MKFYTSDRVELDYDDFGAENQQTVAILSGIGAYKEYWEATIDVLVANGYRVINVDARNQGQSEHTNKGLRISKHAMDLRELLQNLNITKPILMGNSMGASTMFAYVSLFGDQNVAGIVDVDQSPKMINDNNWKYGFKDITWSDFHATLHQPFGKATYHNFDNKLFEKLQEIKNEAPYDAELNFPLLVDHAVQDWRSLIANLNCPLLVVCGEKSPYFNPEFRKVMENLSDQVESAVVSEAGHLVMGEQPEKFNKILVNWLKISLS
ncbi:alpha/beta hydrolase [Fructilactobacillus vespulae]|uniref:alpha/beta fold hydrolase n=1 Tax=Fructilactobacillus vespulae TaxID=1249630 RepID=UPI0039B3EAFC